MPIRFSETGPAFPDALVDAMLNGEVVFLCGAGVSSPQLPDFGKLARDTFSHLGVEPSPAEVRALDDWRFEEAIGSLARRLSNPFEVQEAVSALLTSNHPDLTRHSILLRLSQDLSDRPTLVTTNFDTLFERAYEELNTPGSSQTLSLAGQSLPPPGGVDFCGIIHLHGRLADTNLGLASSPLVLTSAQYGDAYMRSGWASRFLFDLLRCKTLVLVGYSAGDAPIRYFLNLLEADRERFKDIKKIYALDGYNEDESYADTRWQTVAVEPIIYRRCVGDAQYQVLWDDLGALADLVDQTRLWRTQRASTILSKKFEQVDDVELDNLTWVFRDKSDLREILIEKVTDAQWFEHFSAQKLWSEGEPGWVLASWCAHDWADRVRIDRAVGWLNRHGTAFASALNRRLTSNPPSDPLLLKVWRTIADNPPPSDAGHDLANYRLTQTLKSTQVSDSDLDAAISSMRPYLAVNQRYRGADSVKPMGRLSDFVSLRLDIRDRGEIPDLMSSLIDHGNAVRVAEIATENLRKTIEAAKEAELIIPSFDRLDDGVPTVEIHKQNKHRSGVVFLAQLLTGIFDRLAKEAPQTARELAHSWRNLGSRIGRRLWLHALRNKKLFTPDEVAEAIVELSIDDFWWIRRELVLAIVDRLKEADSRLCQRIIDRILTEAPTLLAETPLEPGQIDWRPLARDRYAWLRLTAMKKARQLGNRGQDLLSEIRERHSFIGDDYEESDLFASYSTGVSFVSGDPERIKSVTDPSRRLETARSMASAWDPNAQHNWSAYCSVDPQGALDTLRSAPLGEENAGLWNDLIGSLSWPSKTESAKSKRGRIAVTIGTFAAMRDADDDFLDLVSPRLVDLLRPAKAGGLEDYNDWWDRLWLSLERASEEEITGEDQERFYDRVINRPAGRLTEQLIQEINSRKTKSRRVSPENRARLRRVMSSETQAGWFGRGACAREAGFLNFVDPRGVASILRPWLAADDLQGRTLRTVLVEWSRLGARATKVLKREILTGARESTASSPLAAHVAAKLIEPIYAQRMGRDLWPGTMSEAEVRSTLKDCSPSIQEGALECLGQWVANSGYKPENAWRKAIGPIFKSVWPKERTYQNAAFTMDLARLCVKSGAAFPEAFATIRHFILPFDKGWASVNFLSGSSASEAFPKAALELLWTTCGLGSFGQAYGLRSELDKIRLAEPSLARSRRFQWLEQRAPDFG